jgi:hypothetical protein
MSHEDRPIMSGADAAAWLEEFCGLRAVQIEIQPSLWKLFNRDRHFDEVFTATELFNFARQEQERQARLLRELTEFAFDEFAWLDVDDLAGGGAP